MKISVAMCTYNGERYVAEQVASIMAQTEPPYELLVFDDQSSDGTVAVVERLARDAAFPIRCTVNEERLGSTRNFERAINACSGDIIALSDQDDVWVPHKLAVIRDAFARDPELGAFFSDSEVVDDELRPLGYSMFDWCKLGPDAYAQLDRGDVSEHIIKAAFVTGAALAFRSDLRKVISPVPLGVDWMIHDRWIAIIVAATSKLGYTRDKLILYRQHAQQQLGAELQSSTFRDRLYAKRHRNAGWYADELAFLKPMRGFVDAAGGEGVKPTFRTILDERIRHLEARTELPANRLGRLNSIYAELVSGRYARFSNGWTSAMKDLFLS